MSQTWNAFRAEQASKGLTIGEISSKYRAMKESRKASQKGVVLTRKSGARSKAPRNESDSDEEKKEPPSRIKTPLSLLTSPLLRTSMWSKAATTLHSAWRECSMDQTMFFKFVDWIKPKEHKFLKVEEQAKRKVEEHKAPPPSDSEEDSEEESEGETAEPIGDALTRMDWLYSNGWTGDPAWMCDYVTRKLNVRNVKVLSLIGVGMRSFVAMVMHKNEKRAMRVTHLTEVASPEEARIQTVLSANGLAPRVVHREKTAEFNVEIMDAVVTTFNGFLNLVTLDERVAADVARVFLHIVGKLQALHVMHGDLHLDNVGITVEGSILIFDFDQSSSRIMMPGFDLAVLYDMLDPDAHDDRNEKFLKALRRLLIKHVHNNWLVKNRKNFNEEKLDHARQLWANYMLYTTPKNFQKLQDFAGPIVARK